MNLKNKKALIIGVASNRSIAAAIATAFGLNGANLVLTFQTEKLKSRVEDIAREIDENIECFPCDLSSDEEIVNLKNHIKKKWGKLDIIIHSAAYAPRELLAGDYVDNVTREGFNIAHDISSYSFVALAKEFSDILNENSSLLTLTYLGSQKVIKNYNIMGLAISAGPIKTLAAAGISGFNEILKHVEERAPLKRNITLDDVANTAVFLTSDSSSGITGQIIYVDCGYSISGF